MQITLLGAAAWLLGAADWLAFHDVFEHHTVTEYLTLAASMLVFCHVARELAHKAGARC